MHKTKGKIILVSQIGKYFALGFTCKAFPNAFLAFPCYFTTSCEFKFQLSISIYLVCQKIKELCISKVRCEGFKNVSVKQHTDKNRIVKINSCILNLKCSIKYLN